MPFQRSFKLSDFAFLTDAHDQRNTRRDASGRFRRQASAPSVNVNSGWAFSPAARRLVA